MPAATPSSGQVVVEKRRFDIDNVARKHGSLVSVRVSDRDSDLFDIGWRRARGVHARGIYDEDRRKRNR